VELKYSLKIISLSTKGDFKREKIGVKGVKKDVFSRFFENMEKKFRNHSSKIISLSTKGDFKREKIGVKGVKFLPLFRFSRKLSVGQFPSPKAVPQRTKCFFLKFWLFPVFFTPFTPIFLGSSSLPFPLVLLIFINILIYY
jgi:hypothetical protein